MVDAVDCLHDSKRWGSIMVVVEDVRGTGVGVESLVLSKSGTLKFVHEAVDIFVCGRVLCCEERSCVEGMGLLSHWVKKTGSGYILYSRAHRCTGITSSSTDGCT